MPHVVADRYLVTGNAVAPTAGTMAWVVGGLIGLGVRHLAGGDDAASVVLLVLTVPTYLAAGTVALLLGRDELGPDEGAERESVRSIARGLASGIRHLRERRPAARAIAMVGAHRMIFGAATLLTLLQARETLHPGDPEGALAAIGVTSVAAGAGALAGALVTPWLSRRFGTVVWQACALALGVCLGTIGVGLATISGFVVRGLFLGFAGQAVKVCSDTIVQEDVADDHRGRVFSWYDMTTNVGTVIGVVGATLALTAAVSPATMGMAMALVGLTAAGWSLWRERRDPASAYAQDPEAVSPHG